MCCALWRARRGVARTARRLTRTRPTNECHGDARGTLRSVYDSHRYQIFNLENPTFCTKQFEFSCLLRLRASQSACESQIRWGQITNVCMKSRFVDVNSANLWIFCLNLIQSNAHGAVGAQFQRHAQKRCLIRFFWWFQTESVLAEIEKLNTKFVFICKSQLNLGLCFESTLSIAEHFSHTFAI